MRKCRKNRFKYVWYLMMPMILVGNFLVMNPSFAHSNEEEIHLESDALISVDNLLDTEVKFLIDADQVLDSNGNLLAEIAYLFGGFGRDRGRSITMQFMDTPDQVFNAEGFINRIRYRNWNQPAEGYQLTYRRRIPIWPVNHENIQVAINLADTEGFGDWDMSLDWSYNSAVLTLSYTVNTIHQISSQLPNTMDSKNLLINYMPEHITSLYSAKLLEAFNDITVHGPVTFRRYEFNFPGTTQRILRIEVMPIRTMDGTGIDYIVEVSFELENEGRLEVIYASRNEIKDILENADILLPDSGLRTSTILERYKR